MFLSKLWPYPFKPHLKTVIMVCRLFKLGAHLWNIYILNGIYSGCVYFRINASYMYIATISPHKFFGGGKWSYHTKTLVIVSIFVVCIEISNDDVWREIIKWFVLMCNTNLQFQGKRVYMFFLCLHFFRKSVVHVHAIHTTINWQYRLWSRSTRSKEKNWIFRISHW